MLLAGAGLVGCSQSTTRHPDTGPVVFEDRLVIQDTDDRSPLGIPASALPAAGACRLWKRGRPVREQSPACACAQIEPAAPPESWILYRPSQDPRLVHVRVVDPDPAGRGAQGRRGGGERGAGGVRAAPGRSHRCAPATRSDGRPWARSSELILDEIYLRDIFGKVVPNKP